MTIPDNRPDGPVSGHDGGIGFDGLVCGEDPNSPDVEQRVILHRHGGCDGGVTSTNDEGLLPGGKSLTQGAAGLRSFLSGA